MPSFGEWRALDSDPVLHAHGLADGSLYQAQLRNEPTTRLVVAWPPAANQDG